MSETKTDAKYLDQARRIAAGNDLFDGCRSTPEEIREIAERLQREANQEQPMTDAKPKTCVCGDAEGTNDDCERCTLLSHLAAEREKVAALTRERDAANQCKQLYNHALDCVDRVFQQCSEIPNPILPDFCRIGEDKFRAVVRLAKEYIASQSRAERAEGELAKMREQLNERCKHLIEHMEEGNRLESRAERAEGIVRKIATGLSVPGAHPEYLEQEEVLELAQEFLATLTPAAQEGE